MVSKAKLEAMKYIKNEYDNLKKDPILSLGCTVGLNEAYKNDLFHWKLSLIGPADTPYKGGVFILTVDFPENYPNEKPEVRFTNQIYHLNVSPKTGHICISTLNHWVKKTPMVDVISSIFALFYEQNPESPYNSIMATEYKKNRKEFDKKASEWTKKYAMNK